MVKRAIRKDDSVNQIDGVTATEINGTSSEKQPGISGIETVDTTSLESTGISDSGISDSGNTGSGETGNSEGKRGRGRPPGSTQKTSKANIESLASLLSVIHFSLAAVTNCEDLILSEDESERLAKASADVAKHYDLGFTDKQKDIMAFGICAASIYAPKIKNIVLKKK